MPVTHSELIADFSIVISPLTFTLRGDTELIRIEVELPAEGSPRELYQRIDLFRERQITALFPKRRSSSMMVHPYALRAMLDHANRAFQAAVDGGEQLGAKVEHVINAELKSEGSAMRGLRSA